MGYFDKHPGQHSSHDLYKHFSDVSANNLCYHLKTLVDANFLIKRSKGWFEKNPEFVTVEEKRLRVAEHLKTNGSPVQQGEAWKPGDSPAKVVENPVLISYLGRNHGESIIERCEKAGLLSSQDLRYLRYVVAHAYPLSESQRMVMDAVGKQKQEMAARTSPSTNGHANGHTNGNGNGNGVVLVR